MKKLLFLVVMLLTTSSQIFAQVAPIQLAVGQSRTFTINANSKLTKTHLFVSAGQRYRFTVASDDRWLNGIKETNADGYPPNPIADVARRYSAFNMLTLVGEIHRNDEDSFQNNFFKIGTSRTYSPPVTGYLMCFSNDMLVAYGDNSGNVRVTVTRLSN